MALSITPEIHDQPHAETYQRFVAPMGVADMLGVLSRLMRLLFAKYEFIVVYLDNICELSTSLDEHAEHLRIMSGVIRREMLFCHQSKCHLASQK